MREAERGRAARQPPAVREESPITSRDSAFLLLRIAAFLVDATAAAMVLIPPAGLISYSFVFTGGSIRRIGMVWWTALGLFVVAILIRDGFRGRSPGKQLMALRIERPSGSGCGWGRSIVRNFPLVVPGWNLIEVGLLLFGRERRRTGDRIARTRVVEE